MELNRVWKVIICVALCLAAGGIGAFFTETGQWYQELEKPVFNPPSWVFGPVWTTLYILIGIAAGLVWSEKFSKNEHRKRAMRWFWIQLVINTLWSFSFFGLKNPLVGLINIILLLVAILITTRLFFSINKLSGWLMIPYILWVSYATVLNFSIWSLN
jgi:tryptophan-rich sensory protein